MPNNFSAEEASTLRKLRWTLVAFVAALFLSGVTAFPLRVELEQIAAMRGLENVSSSEVESGFDHWILVVRDGLREAYDKHPWLAYGTDWLAFAHIVIAVFFIGPLLNPVRNIWVLKAGLIACLLIIPTACICGEVRQIPWGWRLIDCSFGVLGAILLVLCLKWTRALERRRG